MRTQGATTTSWRMLWPWLGAFGVLSLADWALTSWAMSAGWVRLDGAGWHEGNPVTIWLAVHGGVWAMLGAKGVLFAAMLAVVVGLQRVPWRFARWLTLGALGVATAVQALAVVSNVRVILARGA